MENKENNIKGQVILTVICLVLIYIICIYFNHIKSGFYESFKFLFMDGEFSKNERFKTLTFSYSCSLCSFIIFLLDACVYSWNGHSLLEIDRKNKAIKNLSIAVISPAILGYLGTSLDVIQYSRAGAISVSLGWKFLLAFLFNFQDGIKPRSKSSSAQ